MSDVLNKESTIVDNFSVNVADSTLGAEIIYCSDEFFASSNRLLIPTEPKFLADYYDDNGKWMDGWETQRRRNDGYDYCIIKLAFPCLVNQINIDTTFFTGNSPMAISVDAIFHEGDNVIDQKSGWEEILSYCKIKNNDKSVFKISTISIATHIKFNIYPDGGVSRIKVFGFIKKNNSILSLSPDGNEENLLCMSNGAIVVSCSDMHYGSPINLLKPLPANNMGDGWETRRRRSPGNDWCIFRLFRPGKIYSFELDTSFFKGNYPSHFSIQAAQLSLDDMTVKNELLVYQSIFWTTIVSKSELGPNCKTKHIHVDENYYTHIKLNIYPDGGLSRFKVYGEFYE